MAQRLRALAAVTEDPEAPDPLELWLLAVMSCFMWLLGTKCGPSARAACALSIPGTHDFHTTGTANREYLIRCQNGIITNMSSI
ncbi:mCG1050953 [Mus musculus]|nr:mCG1050953 [Mus musculus]